MGKSLSLSIMTRHQREPFRTLTNDEQQALERISRATSESVTRVARFKALLAVAQGPLLHGLVAGDRSPTPQSENHRQRRGDRAYTSPSKILLMS